MVELPACPRSRGWSDGAAPPVHWQKLQGTGVTTWFEAGAGAPGPQRGAVRSSREQDEQRGHERAARERCTKTTIRGRNVGQKEG